MVFNVFGFCLFKLGDINFTGGGNKDEISSIVKLLCVIKLVV